MLGVLYHALRALRENMRVLLSTIGTAGDVHPFIAVGLALKSRGHEVVVLANPHFAGRINGAGLGFWPLGMEAEYLRFVKHADLVSGAGSPMYVLHNLVLPAMAPTMEAIGNIRVAFRPDVVMAHHISLGAGAACERLQIPLALAVLAPLFWLSREEHVVMPTLPMYNPPRWLDRIARRAMRPLGRWSVDRPINRARRAAGLSPVCDAAITVARGGDGLLERERIGRERATAVLGLWSEHFRAVMKDDPTGGEICGFAVWDRPAQTAEGAAAERETIGWMEQGDPPAVVTLGSSVSHHGSAVYEMASAACARLGRRALLLTGASGATAERTGARAVEYAPYSRVMPRGCVTVHHGGIGTTAAAMRSGRPQVIIPFANDEFDNAARAERLGAAVRLSRRRLSIERLCGAIGEAATDARMIGAAASLGDRLRGEDGAARAAEALERVARSR